ncbi:DNA-directed RNA polymerase specialized sigma subunit, sigma24 homolog [Solibacillus silvestris StLB046]|uniref:DNA-directed RNA polymerase specialized sigma subunit, sigma24 homolog n=1 Tax=Solibacillus silvestris (strain StLB046) TaxID=1002809 RepID=F2F9G2_SOLSS|nr:RNA polymerase sigma factor [Solibacillus silvestris]BAK16689.1 DNA-directed RNA polymerase specialized sigma subunit, sigma24 homolog [Solibacillus silvestris StLB046]
MSKMNPLVLIEEIYNEHYAYLRNFLIGLTKSDVIADDIIQDFFTKILVSPSIVTEVKYMRSWLITGVKNTLLDYYKKKKPELLQDENIIETLLVDNYTPEVSATINNELETILGKLSTSEKAIIIAKEYYGYDYNEISNLLNIPVSTIKSIVFRMRKRMIKVR